MTLTGGMRNTDENTRLLMKEKIKEMVESIALAFGARATVSFSPGYKALINNQEINQVIRQTAHEVLGVDCVHEKEHPSLGVEDYSYFLDHAKGAFYHLGCGDDGFTTGPLHSKNFYVDERCLPIGVYLQIKLIENVCEKYLTKR